MTFLKMKTFNEKTNTTLKYNPCQESMCVFSKMYSFKIIKQCHLQPCNKCFFFNWLWKSYVLIVKTKFKYCIKGDKNVRSGIFWSEKKTKLKKKKLFLLNELFLNLSHATSLQYYSCLGQGPADRGMKLHYQTAKGGQSLGQLSIPECISHQQAEILFCSQGRISCNFAVGLSIHFGEVRSRWDRWEIVCHISVNVK